MIRREIQMEFDHFDEIENFHARYEHGPDGGWVFESDVAADIVADWEHKMKTRLSTQVGSVIILVDVAPDGRPFVGHWASRNGLFRLNDFPLTQTFRVTTDPPPVPRKAIEPTEQQFAAFGRWFATVLATSPEWNSDTLQDAACASEMLGEKVDNEMDAGAWLMWERIARDYGLEMPGFEGD